MLLKEKSIFNININMTNFAELEERAIGTKKVDEQYKIFFLSFFPSPSIY
jgi:hypothetical protein